LIHLNDSVVGTQSPIYVFKDCISQIIAHWAEKQVGKQNSANQLAPT